MILAAATPAPSEQFLLTEHDWVRVNSKAVFWLDVAVFEQAFSELRWKSCSELDSNSAQRAQEAIDLYTGDLLEGCYQDWCLCERERLQNMYLIILDKLMGYSAVTQWYEKALEYGALILSKDRAHERTHRKLMLLQYQAGNRSEALRQYERCCAALAEELDVKPDRRTRALYEQIKQDKLSLPVGPVLETPPLSRAPERPLAEVLDELRMLQTTLHNIHQELQQKIRIVELTLNDHR
jgi:DNA-binding SARP family transcriptional activator